MTVISLCLGFNFLPSCLKAITGISCQNRHGIRCVHVLCSSHRPHHSISNGARLPPWLLPIISYNIWRCGARLQAPVEVCVTASCNAYLKRTLRKLKTDCAGRAASAYEQPAIVMHYHLSATRQDAKKWLLSIF
ncbi:hypothetical protein PAMP_023037 [Pampus punctatissimus]